MGVFNVQTALANPLVSPASITFDASPLNFLPSIGQGATSDDAESILRKNLSSGLAGKGWDAVIAGIAAGDQYLFDLGKKAFDQLFISTASGKYLDERGSDYGVIRPPKIGMPDDIYRQLIITLKNEKLTLQSFLKVLEIFYGKDALRATCDSVATETYNIQDNDDLILEIDGKTVHVFFHNNDFASIGYVSALEVSAAITRYLEINQLDGWAEAVTAPDTGLVHVRIYSGALGMRGTIKVVGGKAQNVLQFPTLIATTQAIGTQWKVAPTFIGSTVRYTFIAGTNPTLSLVHIGDYVNIYGPVFNSANRGAFKITNVTTTYFEIANPSGITEAGIIQTAINDVKFFRPTNFTLNSKDRLSVATQASLTEGEVVLAATTQAVGRTPFTAAYLHANAAVFFADKVPLVSLVRAAGIVTATTVSPHTLAIGDTVYIAPGDPQIGQEFPQGVKTITGIGASTFTYTEAGPAVAATGTQTAYPCYRDSTGLVTLKTVTAHGLTTDNTIITDNLKADTSIAVPINAVSAGTGLVLADYANNSASVKLADGRVLMCGGNNGADLATATIYDPDTNSWSAIASMNNVRSSHTATLLPNGRVLVCGGNLGAPVATAEIYDPDLNVWIPIGNMSATKADHTATLLNNNKVLVVGGTSLSIDIYDYITNTWTTSAATIDRAGHTAHLLKDGQVILVGGYRAGPVALNTSIIYNPALDALVMSKSFVGIRYYHASVITFEKGVSGKVILVGGTPDGVNGLASTCIYDVALQSWSVGPVLADPRMLHAMTDMGNGQILIQGGGKNTASPDDIYIYYDIQQNTIKNNVYGGPVARATHKIFTLDSGKVLVGPSLQTAQDTPELFDPVVGTYTSGGLNGIFKVNVINSTKFTVDTSFDDLFKVVTPIVTNYINKDSVAVIASMTSFKAATDPNHIGPYILDATSGPAITGISTVTTMDLDKGSNYSDVTVTGITDFPVSGGYLVFSFGYSNQLFPVRYTTSFTTAGPVYHLRLDPSYIFEEDIPSGSSVILLQTRGILAPTDPLSNGLFYLTDSIAGRIAASKTLDDIAALGGNIVKTITYPGDIGLGNEGQPVSGTQKIADKVYIWGTEDEVKEGREG